MSYQPTLKYIRQFIKAAETKPLPEIEKVKPWLECEDLGTFFERTSQDWVLIHLTTEDFFLNSFSIAVSNIESYRSKEVVELNDFSLDSGCVSYGYSFAGDEKKYVYERDSKRGPGNSEMWPLFFLRSFEGYKKEQRSYYEILQEYTHFADLHWMAEKAAFCTLNDVGDVEERIVIVDEEDFAAILFQNDELEKYLLYREHFLCRFVEVKRAMPKANWTDREGRKDPIYKSTGDRNSWIRSWPTIGADLSAAFDFVKASHILLPNRTIEELENKEDKHETFVIHDWKNGKVVECSCERSALNSYFEDTGKPFETSPAFFKPDVLLKYKSEPEKYELRERSIYCRGAWSLQTYDINEEGQVHTYICYLRHLPYREQLHWKQYNEPPKGKIAERAFKTDFEAQWVDEYNPLQLIKGHFQKFPNLSTPDGSKAIWKPKEDLEMLLGKLHYVSAGKVSEYKDFLMALTILVVDGLDSACLKSLVKGHPKYTDQMGSLGCLKLLLLQLGLNEEAADSVSAPLRALQTKRSKYGGHGGSQPDFDMVADCRAILKDVESSINSLIQVLNSSSLTEVKS